MILAFLVSLVDRHIAFRWSPSLDLADNRIYNTLMPGAQY